MFRKGQLCGNRAVSLGRPYLREMKGQSNTETKYGEVNRYQTQQTILHVSTTVALWAGLPVP
jgi:hypothetical protein